MKLNTKAVLISGVPNIANVEQKVISSNEPTNRSLTKSEYLSNNTLPKNATLRETVDQKSSVPETTIKTFPKKIQKNQKNGSWRRMKRNVSKIVKFDRSY